MSAVSTLPPATAADTRVARIIRASDAIVSREIAGETFLVPVKGEIAQLRLLFVLDPVGAFIWRHLDGSRDLAAIGRAVVERFAVAADVAERDLLELVEQLREARLIEEGE